MLISYNMFTSKCVMYSIFYLLNVTHANCIIVLTPNGYSNSTIQGQVEIALIKAHSTVSKYIAQECIIPYYYCRLCQLYHSLHYIIQSQRQKIQTKSMRKIILNHDQGFSIYSIIVLFNYRLLQLYHSNYLKSVDSLY